MRNRINLVRFGCDKLVVKKTGITELGKGWESVLNPLGFPEQDYHIAWVTATNYKLSYNERTNVRK